MTDLVRYPLVGEASPAGLLHEVVHRAVSLSLRVECRKSAIRPGFIASRIVATAIGARAKLSSPGSFRSSHARGAGPSVVTGATVVGGGAGA